MLAVIVAMLAVSRAWAEDLDSKTAFRRGVELMEQGRFKAAIPFLKQAEKAFPTNPSVLWNLGIASAEVENHTEALSYWQKYQKVESQDWKAISKLVQTYQAMRNDAARDREIKILYALRRRSTDPKLARAEEFCREQFVVGRQKIFAFELFEPKGEKRIYYRFSAVDGEGNESFFISLGSYELTTQIARELGEIPKTGRVYHIDRYERKTHKAYAFFKEKPTYETVRKAVVDILQGKLHAVSESSH